MPNGRSDAGFSLPGYDVVELLGFGATGEVWLAREAATGDPVALKRVRVAGDAGRDRARREAAVLAGVAHPHLVRLRSVVPRAAELVLVLDHAGGGSLAALLASRGRLTPGEVVTTTAPLAQALGAVHAAGVLHGDVTPANVLFSADGRPLLADLGVARVLGERLDAVDGTREFADPAVVGGGTPVPASDVYGLAAVCFAALTGCPPGPAGGPGNARRLRSLAPATSAPLAEAVTAALHADPGARPTAAELAVRLYDACPAAPVRLAVGPAPDPAHHPAPHPAPHPASIMQTRPGQPTHRLRAAAPDGMAATTASSSASESRHRGSGAGRIRRRAVGRSGRPAAGAAVAAAAALCLAVLAGVVWARADDPRAGILDPAYPGPAEPSGTGASPAPAASSPDWRAVLADLYATRSRAFAGPDPGLLGEVYAPGSPDLAANRRLVEALVRAGARAPDVRLEVLSATRLRAAGAGVTLRVVDRLAPYTVSAAGHTERRPGRPRQTVHVRLQRAGDGWRIDATSALPRG